MKGFASILLFLQISLCLFAQTENTRIKVACIGDSITFGAGLDNTARDSWPSILSQMLGKEYVVQNYGVSGTTMLSAGDHPYVSCFAFDAVIRFQPDIVFIKLGTNDSKPQNWIYKDCFEKDAQSMIDALRALPSSPTIYLCLPAKAFASGKSIRDSVIVQEVIPRLRTVAERNGIPLVDIHAATSQMEEHFPDKIHPDRFASAAIAQSAYQAISQKTATFSLQDYPGVKSKWRGYDKYDFQFEGRDAIVVAPLAALPGKPWIWRPAFFGAFPSVDLAMLALGYHVVYYDVTFLYGSPRSLEMGDHFYEAMLKYYGFSSRVIVEGFSRGGLFAVNWAAKHPDRVACLYLDAPVCDITSWPGRQREELWKEFLKEWNLREEDMENFKSNPIDCLRPLAKAGIPIIGVAGDCDRTVPYEDNLAVLAARYRKMGGTVEVILKPGCDHHPHSLDAPAPIISKLLQWSLTQP